MLPKQEITWQVISDIPVVHIVRNLTNRVKIELDPTTNTEGNHIVITVGNTGTMPRKQSENGELITYLFQGRKTIKSENYDKPIIFEIIGRKIVSNQVLEAEPDGLLDTETDKTFLKQASGSIALPPLLLNPNYRGSITFSVFLEGYEEKREEVIEEVSSEFQDDKILIDPQDNKAEKGKSWDLSGCFELVVFVGFFSFLFVEIGRSSGSFLFAAFLVFFSIAFMFGFLWLVTRK